MRDAVVVPRGKNVYLIIASRVIDKAAFSVARYMFSPAGDDFPDASAALFVPSSKATYPLAKLKTIEAVLDKEIAALPKN